MKHRNLPCTISNTQYLELFSRPRFLLSMEIRTLTISRRGSIDRIEYQLCCRMNVTKKEQRKENIERRGKR